MPVPRHAVWLVCALLSWVRIAHAEPVDQATRSAASNLGYAGVEAYELGDYVAASERLEKAYALLRVPSLGLWAARALVALGRLQEASERYREVTQLQIALGDAAIQKQAQLDAAGELEALGVRVPHLHITIDGAQQAEAAVSINGRPITPSDLARPIPLDPGRHVIEGRYREHSLRTEVVLEEGDRTDVALRFADTRDATRTQAKDPLRALGWTTLAFGGAGLAMGAVAGLTLLGDRSHFAASEHCDLDRNACDAEERRRVQAYNTKRILSGAALIGGGILAGAGVYLLFFRSAPAETPHLALGLAPDSVSVSGRF